MARNFFATIFLITLFVGGPFLLVEYLTNNIIFSSIAAGIGIFLYRILYRHG